MLVLARKLGESVHIGDGIVVTVVEVRKSRVRLGIAAPSAVRIQREEHLKKEVSCQSEEAELAAVAGTC